MSNGGYLTAASKSLNFHIDDTYTNNRLII
jgi:hypothetical protein